MPSINQSMQELLSIDGTMCAASVDSSSGMILGQHGSGVNLEIDAAGNTEAVRAKLKTMRTLNMATALKTFFSRWARSITSCVP